MSVEAAQDLLLTEQLSEAHIGVLRNVCMHLNQVLDLQMLFMDNMGLWYITNVQIIMSHSKVAKLIAGELTKPFDGVLAGIRDLWRTEAVMQEGQEHIRAINQGLVQRLPPIEPGGLRYSPETPPHTSCSNIGITIRG